jgi:membrane protease YdiL (CAAX protease family)
LSSHPSENHSESRIHLVESRGLVALFVASLCLILTTFAADRLASMYLDRVQKIHSWNLAVHYSDTAAGLFMVLQMVLVVIAFGIADQSLRANALRRLLLPDSIKPLLWGALAGIAVSFASSPLLLTFDQHAQFVRLLLEDPISLQTIVIIFLLGLLVPVATEVVFRGIIFDVLARRTNTLVALIISCLLFAYVWAIFDLGVALLIGIACGLLYRRFNSLAPGIVCSATVTVIATVILFLRLLFQA